MGPARGKGQKSLPAHIGTDKLDMTKLWSTSQVYLQRKPDPHTGEFRIEAKNGCSWRSSGCIRPGAERCWRSTGRPGEFCSESREVRRRFRHTPERRRRLGDATVETSAHDGRGCRLFGESAKSPTARFRALPTVRRSEEPVSCALRRVCIFFAQPWSHTGSTLRSRKPNESRSAVMGI